MQTDIEKLKKALESSVKLQSHYAGLLNQYDGGRRMQFADSQAWQDRLDFLEQAQKPKEQKCCFEGCQRTGIPDPENNFYACPECLENLQKTMDEEFAISMDKKHPGWRN